MEPRSPTLQADSLPAESQGKPKNTGVGSLSLLQGIFLTQKLNWGLLHCRQILNQLSYQRSPLLALLGIQMLLPAESFLLSHLSPPAVSAGLWAAFSWTPLPVIKHCYALRGNLYAVVDFFIGHNAQSHLASHAEAGRMLLYTFSSFSSMLSPTPSRAPCFLYLPLVAAVTSLVPF